MSPTDPKDPIQALDVLIVDDAVTVRSKTRALLESLAVPSENIREAESAREALDAFEEDSPDVVLLDLVLPDIPGQELGSVLMDKHPQTNVILLTALDRNDSRVRRLVSKGAYDVIEKPVRRGDINDVLDQLRADVTDGSLA